MKKALILSVIILFAGYVFGQNSQNKLSDNFSKGAIDIGLIVSDLQKSIDFYTNIIGMTVVSKAGSGFTSEQSKIMGFSDSKPFTLTGLKLIDGPENTRLKLVSCEIESNKALPNYVLDNTGVQYITINVKSMKPILENIEKYNIKLLGGSPVPFGENNQFVLIQDPDGTFIELLGAK